MGQGKSTYQRQADREIDALKREIQGLPPKSPVSVTGNPVKNSGIRSNSRRVQMQNRRRRGKR